MAKHEYRVASQEGAVLFQAEVGDTVELDDNDDRKLALVCAGWLEEVKKGGKK